MDTLKIIESNLARIRELMSEIDDSPATENERTLNLMIAHLTNAVAHVTKLLIAQQTDGK